MNLIEFTDNLKHPKNTTIEQTACLKSILDDYPYFQTAHFLYLNGLKNQNSFKYNNYLKKTAAYTTDRSVLFDFISSFDFEFQPNKETINTVKEPKNIKIPDAISEEKVKKDTAITTNKSETIIIGKPIQFNNKESYSFSEWLQIKPAKPIVRETVKKIEKETETAPLSNLDLIDHFIAKKPKIKPVDSNTNTNIATHSVIENENLMTETLAHVYLEQKKYQKAITAFTVLSLKYPEKSSFFANQIKAIKKIQEK